MSKNEFKPFAVASGAAVLGQEEYETSQALREGFKKGLARSVEVNKAIRQASSIAAAVAEFAAEKSGKDMLDNGEVNILKENFEMALSAVSSQLIAEAQGNSDVLTASFSPMLKELKNGMLVHVRAKEKNRTKTPFFKADETGEKVIVKGNNLSIEEGDIAGAGHWLELQYDEALDKWILQNPAKGITPSSGVPIGTISYFGKTDMPAGYLRATGQAVGRETYPDLFAAIGTAYGEGDGTTTFNLPRLGDDIGAIQSFASLHLPTDFARCDGSEISRADYPELFAVIGTSYGEGDGQTTFNLPDLIDRFAQGSNTPGQKLEAGLPNITGQVNASPVATSGCFKNGSGANGNILSSTSTTTDKILFDAKSSNPIYGASDTVQPPALTVCYGIRIKNRLHAAIKAFDAATNPGLINITELVNDIQNAQTPAGTVAWFAMSAPPAGYLIANGAAVGRETYPELFAVIGTSYGEGDGSTTFNLPDLIDRFAQGSNTPGQKIEAGLPNVTGSFGDRQTGTEKTGCFYSSTGTSTGSMSDGVNITRYIGLDASRSNPIYGASDTVQPPALTLLPCIKAFDAATNPGLIDITELANDVADLSANKLDKTINGTTVKYVTETYNDDTNWYRKWSDGWVEQGGFFGGVSNSLVPVTLPAPYADTRYIVTVSINSSPESINVRVNLRTTTYFILERSNAANVSNGGSWYACGQGAQS